MILAQGARGPGLNSQNSPCSGSRLACYWLPGQLLCASIQEGFRVLKMVLRDGSSRGLAAVSDGFAVAGSFLLGAFFYQTAYEKQQL